VTGGTGYVGMKVVAELQSAGREVRVLDSILHGQ
jgi:nucleoside-diphosphate-sugar epimerase